MADLIKTDTTVGTGVEASSGPINVHYTGWLTIRRSPTARAPLTASTGSCPASISDGQVIRADEGVKGKVGGKRTRSSRRRGLRFERAAAPSRRTTLVLDVELIDIR